ncbi:hypothetical protein [Caudoviricetes sp.]|nr:hypothetical protein [Caudoviricetes sp.]UOF79658.1 hypothetical protein [Caudoviricetes sp.]UOF79867.1 hypothetical protein [Bacteriophage sp.]UOF81329.1 hypothetical protein [Caudoviricetes sp.]
MNPAIQVELQVLADLESKGVPHRPNEDTRVLGMYQFGARALLDAARLALGRVPPEITAFYQAYEKPATRGRALSDTWAWMKEHADTVDRIAEEYYVRVIRPMAGNNPIYAMMMYHAPLKTREELSRWGVSETEMAQQWNLASKYLDYVATHEGGPERRARAQQLQHWRPALEEAGRVSASKVWQQAAQVDAGIPNAEAEALQEGWPSLTDVLATLKKRFAGESPSATPAPIEKE